MIVLFFSFSFLDMELIIFECFIYYFPECSEEQHNACTMNYNEERRELSASTNSLAICLTEIPNSKLADIEKHIKEFSFFIELRMESTTGDGRAIFGK